MNWTGGRLSRHSRRADSSTTSKQKQHFAKVRSHLMSGSVKKGPAKRPNFDMAAPRPPDGLRIRDGTVRTQPGQPLAPLSHDLHTYHGVYVENKRPGRADICRHGQPGYLGSNEVSKSSIHSYETKPEPIINIEPVDGDYEEQDDMEAIRRKRFRILREGDWLGLSIQRPLQLKYMESESRDAIGKRRKLNAGYGAQYSRVQDKITSPFAPNRHIPSREIFPNHGENQPQSMQYGQTPGAKGSVRIFIDGRERHVRESSGSVINQPHPEYVQSSASSDVMLLDLEGSRSRPRLPHQRSSDMANSSECFLEPVEHGRQGSEEKSMSSIGKYPSSGPRIHQIRGPTRNMYPPSLQIQSSPILTIDRTKTNWPGASPVIYHPTPKSSTTSRLLRSNSSVFEGSVAATAGRKGIVTASVARDEEMWRSWLVAESDEQQSPAWPADDESDQLAPDIPSTSYNTTQSRSPGLSYADPSTRDDESGHGRELIPSIQNSTSSVNGSPNDENSGNNNTKPSFRTGISKPRGPGTDDIQLPSVSPRRQPKEENRNTAWEKFVLAGPSENLADLAIEPPQKVAQEDPDAAWKKFVLSSDSDDDSSASSTENEAESKTSASQKRMQKSSSKISLQVNPAETVVHSDPRLDHSSGATSARVTYNPSTRLTPSRSNGSEASVRLSGTSMYTDGSASEASQASRYFPQATSKLSQRVVNKRNLEDPLARYMPRQPESECDIVMAKEAQLPARNESFERGLDDSLKQALHLGRRYSKQEKERHVEQKKETYTNQEKVRYGEQEKGGYVKQKNEGYEKRKSKETRDIYDIPISDDTEEVDDV
ncbi:hypothetical protein VC83_03173 [Pseudogymnoascus destructans]|uniref:Uncharacterized protein n=2 Tax=Pseudogymnoascus destructans TaxID=655981 RepID=L8G830_PSED2|nr:uncharacterized protein VC83_03173 [Pseudogymnoascus destructans]ELR09395.1 hypothetical protein GMDG_03959 [Pseudogymnoascus destructans 20631-21]OAF60237.2 hypothetical protein VC83_03173 [Pseudogymnoascus destructans]